MKITVVAGTRPNFVKIAPILDALERRQKEGVPISYRLIHTGQHYDKAMSEQFFQDLCIPEPDVNLGVGGGTQAYQTGNMMMAFESELLQNRPDLVLVVGDVTSTMACAITAKKLNIPVAHVEAGIRSFDMTMPEEVNRKVTDSITDFYFTTSEFANQNLRKEGVGNERIFFVGNVMIDTLLKFKDKFEKPSFFDSGQLSARGYVVVTLHRPSNVDDPGKLNKLVGFISNELGDVTIVFPMHPRTRKNFDSARFSNLILAEPMSYLSFNYLVANSMGVVTDSGGITEEATVLNIPCITIRNTTERPETVTFGTNVLVGDDEEKLRHHLSVMKEKKWKTAEIPPLWDGKSAERIVQILINHDKN